MLRYIVCNSQLAISSVPEKIMSLRWSLKSLWDCCYKHAAPTGARENDQDAAVSSGRSGMFIENEEKGLNRNYSAKISRGDAENAEGKRENDLGGPGGVPH